MDIEWTRHAREMLEERSIEEEWVLRAIRNPDRTEMREDGNKSYVKAIAEFGDRYLRVVVKEDISPNRVITVFFDKRLGRKS